VAHFFWTERARRAYDAGHYQQAVGLAKHSLDTYPNQPPAWEVLGWSEFALANFPEAAAAYRRLLDSAPSNENYLHAYADSLAACGDLSRAIQEYQIWLSEHPEGSSLAVRKVDLAGLMLVVHDKVGADAAIAQLKTVFGVAWPPEFEGRIGWWNYRAGNYSAAMDHLTQAAHQRPGEVMFSTQLGWAFIERRNFEDALNRFDAAKRGVPLRLARGQSHGPRLTAEPRMGSAVAHWLARQSDEALKEFSVAVDAQPEWLNPKWTRALYSQTVVQAVSEMQAEKRKQRTPQRLP
jgi:tetratricopeptide (TPR) repeat protein